MPVSPGFNDIEVTTEVGSSQTFNIAPNFNTVEISRELGAPVSLYFFKWGDHASSYYAYTDAEEPVSYAGKTYNPIPIGREKIKASGSLDKTTLKVETTLDSEIAQLYLTGGPSHQTTLTIYQGHVGSTDFKAVFMGRLVGLEPRGPLVEISAEPASTSMRGPGLRRHFQYGCPFVLYHKTTCKADPDAVKKSATVSAYGKADITLAAGWNELITLAKFRNGYITWTAAGGQTEIRTIIEATATAITLTRKLSNITVGTTLTIYPGCNHQVSDCTDLHVELGTGNPNIVNFGGQPYIPVKNPIGLTGQYY